jgi:ribosomal protein S27AE
MSAPPPRPKSETPSSFVEPLAAMVNEDEESEKSMLDDQPAVQKKACPACKKQMFWYRHEKAWRCPSCHYERRI